MWTLLTALSGVSIWTTVLDLTERCGDCAVYDHDYGQYS